MGYPHLWKPPYPSPPFHAISDVDLELPLLQGPSSQRRTLFRQPCAEKRSAFEASSRGCGGWFEGKKQAVNMIQWSRNKRFIRNRPSTMGFQHSKCQLDWWFAVSNPGSKSMVRVKIEFQEAVPPNSWNGTHLEHLEAWKFGFYWDDPNPILDLLGLSCFCCLFRGASVVHDLSLHVPRLDHVCVSAGTKQLRFWLSRTT